MLFQPHTNHSDGPYRSPSCRRSGLPLVELLVLIAIIGTLLGLLLAAIQRVRAVSARLACSNQLRQVAIALHQFHDVNHRFPPGVAHPRTFRHPPFGPPYDPFPLLNWQGRLLPYLEQEAMWKETVNSYAVDPNRKRVAFHPNYFRFVSAFACPAEGRRFRPHSPERTPGPTSYLGISGTTLELRDGILFLNSAIRLADVTDGTSSTLMVGERPPNVGRGHGRWYGGWGPWMIADSYLGFRETVVSRAHCPEAPYPFQRGQIEEICSSYHFWSLHPGGANFAFADGSVRFLIYGNESILAVLATRADGDVANTP